MTEAAKAAVAEGVARWANPSSPHAEGRAARAALEDARARIANAYGWPHDLILTSGASEALTIALDRASAKRRLISAVEHDSAIRAAGEAAMIPVDANGIVSPEGVSTALDTNGREEERSSIAFASSAIVAIQWANSETGVRQPIAELAEVIHAAGALLLVDAAQMPAGIDSAPAEHADFLVVSAHKRGGPPGVGALLVRDFGMLSPTGGQERGYRPGTENLPGALGFAAAVEEPEDVARMAAMRATLDDAIVRSGGDVVAAAAERHPAIGAYRMRGVAAAAQLIRFDLAGMAVSAGSACSSGSMKPSHVLAAMGWQEPALREVVRVSFGRSTTEEDVARFIAAWRQIARETRSVAA